MSEEGGYSIDQLMELAGLSCSQAGTWSSRAGAILEANSSLQCTRYTRHRREETYFSLVGLGIMVGKILYELVVMSLGDKHPSNQIDSTMKLPR